MARIFHRVGKPVLVSVLLVMPGLGPGSCAAGADATPTNARPRLKFAVLPFRNASGDPALDPWRLALASRLEGRLALAEGLRAESWANLRHALTNAGWTFKTELDPKVVPEVARRLKLDKVLWGSFTRSSNGWALQISLLQRPFTNPPSVLEVKSARTTELLADAPLTIAGRLGGKLPPNQREKWLRHGAGSNAAWDGWAGAESLWLQDASNSEQVSILRQVLAEEPGFVPARAGLANVLRLDEKAAEAEAECRAVIKQTPDLCTAHETLAGILKDPAAAEAETREALRLQPECPRAFLALVFVLYNQHRWKDLRDCLEKANREHPGETFTLALLAAARARCDDPDGAAALLAELGDATEEQDLNVHAGLAEAALGCGDLVRGGGETRWLQRRAKSDPDCANMLQASDASCFVRLEEPFSISRPQAYRADELQAELRRRLTAQELTLVVNPVEITPEIATLAKEITSGLTNPVLRAMLLFAEVGGRGRGSGDIGARTAKEALQVSQQPEGRFSCQEFAKLFVSLARAVGLEAWLVHVDEDATGRATYHDCVALFLAGQGYLVDPTWRLFMVRHHRYRVMDDLQAIAHHSMQKVSAANLPRLRVGQKLDPDDTWTRLRLVCGLARADRVEEAASELKRVPAADTNRWDYWDASAELQAARKNWALARDDLLRALSISPGNAMIHSELKGVYGELGDMKKALEHAEAELRFGTNQLSAAERSKLQSEAVTARAFEQARTADAADRQELERKALAGDQTAQLTLAKLLLDARPPRLEEAVNWLHKAADQGNAIAQENYARNLWLLRGKDAGPEVVRYLTLSAEQEYRPAQAQLGRFLYEGKLVPRDPVAACQWTFLAAKQGDERASFLLKEMRLFMDKDQLAEAQRRADQFKPKTASAPKTQ